ncbi:MAG: 4-hydroxyphenylacetate decarboxylase small subunit [Armatimonadota bacterium]
MTQNNFRHINCINFAPVDVIKGICHKTKKTISSDGNSCKNFVKTQKCGYCKNFTPASKETNLGICKKSKNDFFAYADMAAVTCGHYE